MTNVDAWLAPTHSVASNATKIKDVFAIGIRILIGIGTLENTPSIPIAVPIPFFMLNSVPFLRSIDFLVDDTPRWYFERNSSAKDEAAFPNA